MSSTKMDSYPILYPEKGQPLFNLTIFSIVLSTLTLALRIWSRKISQQHFGPDDWTVFLAWPFVLAMDAETELLMRHGFGLHLTQVFQTSPTTLENSLKVLFAGYLTYQFGIGIIRISAIFFYRRIFASPGNSFRLWAWIGIALNVAWIVGIELAAVFNCNPVYGYWDKTINPQCVSTLGYQLGSGISSIILDLYTLLLPMPVIWKLQLAHGKRMLLLGTFILAYCVIVCTIGRTVTVAKSGTVLNNDVTWGLVDVLYWLVAEITVAFFCISLPSIFSLIQRGRIKGWRALFTRSTIVPSKGSEDYSLDPYRRSNKGFRSIENRTTSQDNWSGHQSM